VNCDLDVVARFADHGDSFYGRVEERLICSKNWCCESVIVVLELATVVWLMACERAIKDYCEGLNDEDERVELMKLEKRRRKGRRTRKEKGYRQVKESKGK